VAPGGVETKKNLSVDFGIDKPHEAADAFLEVLQTLVAERDKR
jgi:hypothetical protein